LQSFILTPVNGDDRKIPFAFLMLDPDFRLIRCERHIADLTLRIAELKGASSPLGSGLIHSPELIELLQRTLESWQEHKRSLTT
jgi:hypothetical protein